LEDLGQKKTSLEDFHNADRLLIRHFGCFFMHFYILLLKNPKELNHIVGNGHWLEG